MEDDNKVEIEIGKDRKSYAGIPEADFVVSDLLIFSLRVCARAYAIAKSVIVSVAVLICSNHSITNFHFRSSRTRTNIYVAIF